MLSKLLFLINLIFAPILTFVIATIVCPDGSVCGFQNGIVFAFVIPLFLPLVFKISGKVSWLAAIVVYLGGLIFLAIYFPLIILNITI